MPMNPQQPPQQASQSVQEQPDPQKLIADLGLDELPEEERSELLSDIGEVVFEAAMRKTLQNLPPEKQDALIALFDASTADPQNEQKAQAIEAYLKEHAPDFERYLVEESASFRETQQQIYGELTS